jgi:lysophospholipase L1-like esterase
MIHLISHLPVDSLHEFADAEMGFFSVHARRVENGWTACYNSAVPFHSTKSTAMVGLSIVAIGLLFIGLMAPLGVNLTRPLVTFAGIATGTAVAMFLLGASWLYRRDPQRWLLSTRFAVIVVSILTIGLTIRATADLQTGTQVSTNMVKPAPELGFDGMLLQPNLKDALTVAADRPHHPDDVSTPDRMQRFKRVRSFLTNTGSRGLRGAGFATPAPGFRVVCIGDSITFGWGVADDASYPAQLEKLLGVEVLNAGMPAAKPSHMARWLSLHARTIDADLVVFGARPNWDIPNPIQDYARAVTEAAQAVAPAKLVVVLPPISTFDPLGVRESDGEAERLQNILKDRPMLDLKPIFRDAQHAPGVVMEIDGQHQRLVRLPDRTLLAEGTAQGDHMAPAIVAVFEADHGIAEPLFFDGGHPDAAGYALFAQKVAAFLQANGLLPRQ